MKQIISRMKLRAPRADRLADSVFILLAMTAVQRLIGFTRSVLFCLWLSVEDLGQWDIAFSFLTLAVPIAVLSLPGAFGRYVAYYRQRGQLRIFLRRTLMTTACLGAVAGVCLAANRFWFSQFIFGREDRGDLVLAVVFAFTALIAYNVVAELLISLRMQRLASSLEMANTIGFALFGAVLVVGLQKGTVGVVLAYGLACLLPAAASLLWLVPLWRSLPANEGSPPGLTTIWVKIVPFAAALWVANALGNVFSIADRYVLVHYSGLDAASSLTMVGEYHGSRIVPMLLVNVCGLLATVSTPFLSHDWEAGPRSRVSDRLNFLLKLTGLGLVAISTAVIFLSPVLFDHVFHGKFQTAPTVLALALAYSSWSGLVAISKTYLWCAEKAMLVSVAYAVGLVASIGMNLMLVPRYGIYGAAAGTCVAQVVLLAMMYGFGRRFGLVLHPATWIISALPLALVFGPWTALTALGACCLLAYLSDFVFTAAERREMAETYSRYEVILQRLGMERVFNSARQALFAAGRAVGKARPWPTSAPATHAARRGGEPMRVMFIHTSLFTGGAEMLLLELIRGLDRRRFAPEICCLKQAGPLREQVPDGVPVFDQLIKHKYDLPVVWRLAQLFRQRKIDAIVSVGAGDRMFWGRLGARLAGVPVIAAWIHSTGWPDRLGRLNRLLTPITDAFIGVAVPHGRYLVDVEKLPEKRVHVVENGVDIDRFRPRPADQQLRTELGLPATAPLAGIVARLSEEKNHALLLRAAALVREQISDAHFVIVGDGPLRDRLKAQAQQLGIEDSVRFLGNRTDVPDILALLDVFVLSSHIEANPVSILEALATGKPVVATRVGSVSETVRHGEVGYVVEPGDASALAGHIIELLRDPRLARRLGAEGRRQVVERYSMTRMIDRYQGLLEQIFAAKAGQREANELAQPAPVLVPSSLLSSEG